MSDDFDILADLDAGMEFTSTKDGNVSTPSISTKTGLPMPTGHNEYVSPNDRYYMTLASVPNRLALFRIWLGDTLSAYMSMIEDEGAVITKPIFIVAKNETINKSLNRYDVAFMLTKFYMSRHYLQIFQQAHGPLEIDINLVCSRICEEESIAKVIKRTY